MGDGLVDVEREIEEDKFNNPDPATQAQKEYALEHARALNQKASEYGGIDLTPTYLKVEEEGQKIDFNFPDLQNFDNIPINPDAGFSPFIFQIIPANLPLLFGSSAPQEKDKVSLAR